MAASAAAIAGASLAGCSVDVKGDPKPSGLAADKPASPFPHAVSGPSLDGEWLSGCVRDKWERDRTQYERIRVVIGGQKIERTAQKYGDAYCTQAGQALSGSGLFRYSSAQDGGIYQIEYQIAAGSRGFPGLDAVKRDGPRMWMSNGNLMTPPDIEFQLQSPPPAAASMHRVGCEGGCSALGFEG